MGWSFACDPRHGRKELIQDLRTHLLPPGYGMLQSQAIGNNFWYLYKDQQGVTRIGLSLMQGGGRDRGMGWGHKDMEERDHPYYYNCPISYLSKASPAEGKAVEWRESVRKYHATKSRPWQVRDQILFSGRLYELMERAGPGRGWYIRGVDAGGRYRISAQKLATAELQKVDPCDTN